MDVEVKRCKWCSYKIKEDCVHLQCKKANARGFCQNDCAEAYDKKRQLDLRQAASAK